MIGHSPPFSTPEHCISTPEHPTPEAFWRSPFCSWVDEILQHAPCSSLHTANTYYNTNLNDLAMMPHNEQQNKQGRLGRLMEQCQSNCGLCGIILCKRAFFHRTYFKIDLNQGKYLWVDLAHFVFNLTWTDDDSLGTCELTCSLDLWFVTWLGQKS